MIISFQISNLGLVWKANDIHLDPEYVPFINNGIGQSKYQAEVVSRPSLKPQPIYTFGVKINL